MPAIDLSGIYSRPFSDSEEPTTYGPDDHSSGTGAIDLSRIMLRPYEDNRLSSIGGSGIDDPDDGDDGGDGGGDFGQYSFFINNAPGEQAYAWRDFAGQTSVYASIDIFMPQAAYDAFLAEPLVYYTSEFLELSSDNDPLFVWEALYLTTLNPAFVEDGNLYLWDYYSDDSEKMLFTPDVVHNVEVMYRVNFSTNEWEGGFKLDGVASDIPSPFFPAEYPADLSGLTTVVTGSQYAPDAPVSWYLDNLKISFDNWISEGGTIAFESDFETGDFSDFTGTFGSVTLSELP